MTTAFNEGEIFVKLGLKQSGKFSWDKATDELIIFPKPIILDVYMKSMIKKLLLIGFLLTLLITLGIYSNHFNNPFFFDDSHTIVNNSAITNLDNWTSFFTNPETFSSLPANRAYRPVVTFLNAIDYAISGELNPLTYHIHIFFWYIITVLLFLVLMIHLSKKANLAMDYKSKIFLTLTTLFFATHTINAETINYICARSDSFSTLCFNFTFVIYKYAG